MAPPFDTTEDSSDSEPRLSDWFTPCTPELATTTATGRCHHHPSPPPPPQPPVTHPPVAQPPPQPPPQSTPATEPPPQPPPPQPPTKGTVALLSPWFTQPENPELAAVLEAPLRVSVRALMTTHQHVLRVVGVMSASGEPPPSQWLRLSTLFPEELLASLTAPNGLKAHACLFEVTEACLRGQRCLLETCLLQHTGPGSVTRAMVDEWLDVYVFQHLATTQPTIADRWRRTFGMA